MSTNFKCKWVQWNPPYWTGDCGIFWEEFDSNFEVETDMVFCPRCGQRVNCMSVEEAGGHDSAEALLEAFPNISIPEFITLLRQFPHLTGITDILCGAANTIEQFHTALTLIDELPCKEFTEETDVGPENWKQVRYTKTGEIVRILDLYYPTDRLT